MKTTLLLTIFCTLIVPANAQENWPPIGAKWYYSYRLFNIGETGPKAYIYFEVEKDTTVNDTVCRKIIAEYHKGYDETIFLGYEYFFSTEDKVFNFHHGRFNILYDYTLQTGDSVTLFLGSNSGFYEKLGSDVHFDSIGVKHDVTDRDSIEINGHKYLAISLEVDYSSVTGIELVFDNTQIIKGIGSVEFLTGKLISPIECDFYGPLRCYSGGTINYSSDIPCDTIFTAIDIKQAEEKNFVYPNPIDDGSILTFTNEASVETTVIIVNSSGNTVKKAITTMGNLQLNSDEFSNGIYFYRIITDNKLLGAGKFVKR